MNESAQAVVTCELRDLGGSQAWHTVLPAARRALSPYSTCARCYMQESRALSLRVVRPFSCTVPLCRPLVSLGGLYLAVGWVLYYGNVVLLIKDVVACSCCCCTTCTFILFVTVCRFLGGLGRFTSDKITKFRCLADFLTVPCRV